MIKPIDMIKYTNEELLEILPAALKDSNELTKAQKVVMGQLVIYDGLDKKNSEGFFFRSNSDLCNDCEISEPTLIRAIRKLGHIGLIETKRGSRGSGASLYKINEELLKGFYKSLMQNPNNACVDNREIVDKIKELELLLNYSKNNLSNDFSTDTDEEIEIDKDVKELVYNILKYISIDSLKKHLSNILEECSSTGAYEEGGVESATTENQQTDVLLQQQSSNENNSRSWLIDGSTEIAEVTIIPIEEEQYQQWFQIVDPFLKEIEDCINLGRLEDIRRRMVQVVNDYYCCHEDTSKDVLDRIDKLCVTSYKTKKEQLTPFLY